MNNEDQYGLNAILSKTKFTDEGAVDCTFLEKRMGLGYSISQTEVNKRKKHKESIKNEKKRYKNDKRQVKNSFEDQNHPVLSKRDLIFKKYQKR